MSNARESLSKYFIYIQSQVVRNRDIVLADDNVSRENMELKKEGSAPQCPEHKKLAQTKCMDINRPIKINKRFSNLIRKKKTYNE